MTDVISLSTSLFVSVLTDRIIFPWQSAAASWFWPGPRRRQPLKSDRVSFSAGFQYVTPSSSLSSPAPTSLSGEIHLYLYTLNILYTTKPICFIASLVFHLPPAYSHQSLHTRCVPLPWNSNLKQFQDGARTGSDPTLARGPPPSRWWCCLARNSPSLPLSWRVSLWSVGGSTLHRRRAMIKSSIKVPPTGQEKSPIFHNLTWSWLHLTFYDFFCKLQRKITLTQFLSGFIF